MMQTAAIRLERLSLEPPKGLQALLADLGEGENGFGGTPVHRGEMSIQEFLQRCEALRDPAQVPSHLVPQTIFWVLDAQDRAVGMVRLRHCLNERLRDQGGHIGYYIKPDQRGRGYGQAALRLALIELRALGEERALLTVDLSNSASIRVIEANGGRLESTGHDETNKQFGRYWIELSSG